MKQSIYDIAYFFVNKYYKEISEEEIRVIVRSIREALKNGRTCDEINNEINKHNKINQTVCNFFSGIRQSGNKNLLDQSKFYYHNELRIVPPPPIRKIDFFEDDIFVSKKDIEEEFYLEMRCSYTIDDLYSYISSKKSFINVLKNKSKVLGGLNFLLNKYDIENILFMIEIADGLYFDKKKFAKNILDITEFEIEAVERLERCKTNALLNSNIHGAEGNTKIKKKNRTLLIRTLVI